MDTPIRVGELAKRTGLTVRALHHYDELGLLTPARRTRAGHRLYGVDELRRLQAIVSLRQLGLSLGEIGERLDGSDAAALDAVLEEHVVRARERIADEHRLVARLEGILARLRASSPPTLDDLIESLEVTIMFEKYYTPEQLEQLAARRDEVGAETLAEVHRRWEDITGRVRAAMAGGTDPGSPEGRSLGAAWKALTEETVAGFTGGDPGIRASLERLWREEPGAGAQWGMDPEIMAWAARAVEAAGEPDGPAVDGSSPGL